MTYAVVILTNDPDGFHVINKNHEVETVRLPPASPIDAVRQLLEFCEHTQIHNLRVGDLSAIQRRAGRLLEPQQQEGE